MTRARPCEWIAKAMRRVPRRRATPFNLDDAASPAWDERAQVAAALLAQNLDSLPPPQCPLRIADFGAGTERLDAILAGAITRRYTYAPFDLIPQSDRVRRIDVTRSLPVEDFDVVFCLGLLEYVTPLERLLARLAARYPVLVVSYALFDAPDRLTRRERRRRGWLTHYQRDELEAELVRHGFAIADAAITNRGRTGVWLLRSAATAA
jgi:SAM-dependent methyltransferase